MAHLLLCHRWFNAPAGCIDHCALSPPCLYPLKIFNQRRMALKTTLQLICHLLLVGETLLALPQPVSLCILLVLILQNSVIGIINGVISLAKVDF